MSIPNHVLYHKEIYNVRRSNMMWDALYLHIDFETPSYKVAAKVGEKEKRGEGEDSPFCTRSEFSHAKLSTQIEALEDVYRACLKQHPDDFDEEQSFFLLAGIENVNKLQVSRRFQWYPLGRSWR